MYIGQVISVVSNIQRINIGWANGARSFQKQKSYFSSMQTPRTGLRDFGNFLPSPRKNHLSYKEQMPEYIRVRVLISKGLRKPTVLPNSSVPVGTSSQIELYLVDEHLHSG